MHIEIDAGSPDKFQWSQLARVDKPEAGQHGGDAQCQIHILTELLAVAYHQRTLAAHGILLAVAIVVHHQQGVYGEATDERQHHHIHIQRIGLHVVGAAYGHEAEEHQHQYVAPAPIGEQRGIEESKQYAYHAQHHQFPASVGQLPPNGEQHCQPCQARQCQCDADAGFHGCRRNPTFGAGALRPQPVFPTVGPFLEVEEVVDKVGGNLHAAGKEGAQQGGCGLELSVAEGKGTAQQYRDDGSRQRLGAGGEKPCVG